MMSVNNVQPILITSTLCNLQLLLNEWEARLQTSGGALSATKSCWTEIIDFL